MPGSVALYDHSKHPRRYLGRRNNFSSRQISMMSLSAMVVDHVRVYYSMIINW